MSSESILLPNGDEFMIHFDYTKSQAMAVILLVAISCLSLAAVVFLLLVVFISFVKQIRMPQEGQFVRTHVAAYFVSLLLTDLLQAVGSIMNARWVDKMSVDYGNFCTAQGVIKMAADVGTATWTLIIALHTFNVLFLKLDLSTGAMIVALVGGWCFIGMVVIAGPATLDTVARGPYFGISGFWCWISEGYTVEWITLDYMFLFISASTSFVLYTLVFLHLRGNILIAGKRLRFRRVGRSDAFHLHPRVTNKLEARAQRTAKHMLLYPIAYTIIILPIACTRFTEWTGHTVPFPAVIFTDVVYLLSGFVNASLFLATRRILPLDELLPTFIRKRTNLGGLTRTSTLSSLPDPTQSISSIHSLEKPNALTGSSGDLGPDANTHLAQNYQIQFGGRGSITKPITIEIDVDTGRANGVQPDNEASPMEDMAFNSPTPSYRTAVERARRAAARARSAQSLAQDTPAARTIAEEEDEDEDDRHRRDARYESSEFSLSSIPPYRARQEDFVRQSTSGPVVLPSPTESYGSYITREDDGGITATTVTATVTGRGHGHGDEYDYDEDDDDDADLDLEDETLSSAVIYDLRSARTRARNPFPVTHSSSTTYAQSHDQPQLQPQTQPQLQLQDQEQDPADPYRSSSSTFGQRSSMSTDSTTSVNSETPLVRQMPGPVAIPVRITHGYANAKVKSNAYASGERARTPVGSARASVADMAGNENVGVRAIPRTPNEVPPVPPMPSMSSGQASGDFVENTALDNADRVSFASSQSATPTPRYSGMLSSKHSSDATLTNETNGLGLRSSTVTLTNLNAGRTGDS